MLTVPHGTFTQITMKYVITTTQKDKRTTVKFYVKDCNPETRELKVEVEATWGKKFDSEDAARTWMKEKKMTDGFSIEPLP